MNDLRSSSVSAGNSMLSMRVVGLSVVTDACFPDALLPADVAEIIQVANAAQPKLEALVTGFLQKTP